MNKRVNQMTCTALIASLYIILTFLSSSLGLAYSGFQFRISEILTVLPIFTPYAIPGLTIGCFISNLGSPYGIADWILGSISTFFAASFTRILRNITIKGIPIFAPLPPVLLGAVIVGFLVSFSLPPESFFVSFCFYAMHVGVSQFFVCYVLGIPFILILKKTRIDHIFGEI